MKFDENIPIYLQIEEYIISEIVIGSLKCGEKLKSVRDYAIELEVNPNTVQKAFRELELSGLLYTERTSGRFVTLNTETINELREKTMVKQIQKFIESVKANGFSINEVINKIKEFDENDSKEV